MEREHLNEALVDARQQLLAMKKNGIKESRIDRNRKNFLSSRCFEWQRLSISSFTFSGFGRYGTTCLSPFTIVSTSILASDWRSTQWKWIDIYQSWAAFSKSTTHCPVNETSQMNHSSYELRCKCVYFDESQDELIFVCNNSGAFLWNVFLRVKWANLRWSEPVPVCWNELIWCSFRRMAGISAIARFEGSCGCVFSFYDYSNGDSIFVKKSQGQDGLRSKIIGCLSRKRAELCACVSVVECSR